MTTKITKTTSIARVHELARNKTAAKARKATKANGKAKVAANGKELSSVGRCRQMIAVAPHIAKDDLIKALAKEGFTVKPASAQTLKADFHGCMRALQFAGFKTPLDD
jgi:hypothetical protein